VSAPAGAIDDPAKLAYAEAGEAWAAGPMLAYLPLARHLVDRCPLPLRDALVLDAGAGTGAATTVLRERGAIVVAADLQRSMLDRLPATPAMPVMPAMPVVASLNQMPFRSGSFDVATAAFVLNHLADPAVGLAELRRVVRPGGCVLASSFSIRRAAAKDTVDATAAAFGWEPPPWYLALQARAATVGTVTQLADAARQAGLVEVHVTNTQIDVGLDDPALFARYRLGMPQLAGFVRELEPSRRRELLEAATAAVSVDVGFRPAVLELVARVSRDEPQLLGAGWAHDRPRAGSTAQRIGGR
jgi:SAM-dependent methyltransferase